MLPLDYVFKIIFGIISAVIAFLFNRTVKKHDEEIERFEKRISSLEEKEFEVARMSLKLDMVVDTLKQQNRTLEEMSKKVQAVEINIAKMGNKEK